MMAVYAHDRSSPVYAERSADGVVVVFLNRPARMNAIDSEMRRDLIALWQRISSDPHVRGLVLTGTGDRAFSSGADRDDRPASGPDAGGFRRTDHLTRSFPSNIVSVAAMEGYALGAGLELALACDIRVCGESATLGLPEVQLGTIPGSGGSVRLRRVVPGGWARHLLLTGETVDSRTAERIGLVTSVVPDGLALERATGLLAGALSTPEDGVRALRGLLEQWEDTPELAEIDQEGVVWRWLRGGRIGTAGTGADGDL
jgi:E-phenylitaconyl-CoA hydratase